MNDLFLVPLLPIPVLLLIIYFIILVRHRKATKQITLFKQTTSPDDAVMTNIKMKFIWTSGMKQIFSSITNCDIYLSDNYFTIVPFQTFPFKAFHKPILLVKEKSSVKKSLHFLNIFSPDKIIFKEVIKDEIEIQYHEDRNKYLIRLKGLTTEDKNRLESIRNCC
jgi:hypothetical protein